MEEIGLLHSFAMSYFGALFAIGLKTKREMRDLKLRK